MVESWDAGEVSEGVIHNHMVLWAKVKSYDDGDDG